MDQPTRIGRSNFHTSTRSPLGTTAPSAGEDAMSFGPTGEFPAAGTSLSVRTVYRHVAIVMAVFIDAIQAGTTASSIRRHHAIDVKR